MLWHSLSLSVCVVFAVYRNNLISINEANSRWGEKTIKKKVGFIFLCVSMFFILSFVFVVYNLRPKYSHDGKYIAKINLDVQLDLNLIPRLAANISIAENGEDTSEYTSNRLWIYEGCFTIISYIKEKDIWKNINYVRTQRAGVEILEGKNRDIIVNIEEIFPAHFNNLIHDVRRLRNWIPW